MKGDKPKISAGYALFRLNETFKVRDIASPLVITEDESEIEEIYKRYNYDRIPLIENGKIEEYYDSNVKQRRAIKPEDVIESNLGILETFSHLVRRDFYFVSTGTAITHIVHYSDLNNPLISIGLYARIAFCEIAIREFAKSNNKYGDSESEIESFLNEINMKVIGKTINIKRAIKHFNDKKKAQAETNMFDELYIDDEFILFREQYISLLNEGQKGKFKKCLNLDEATIMSYTNLRNNIMHPKPQIIKHSTDIQKWLDFLQTCQKAINIIDRKEVFN